MTEKLQPIACLIYPKYSRTCFYIKDKTSLEIAKSFLEDIQQRIIEREKRGVKND